MIKINLLPSHINRRKQVRVAVVLVTLLLAGEIGGLIYARNGPNALKAQLAQKQSDDDAKVQQLTAVKSEADKVNGEEKGFQPKFDFITGLNNFNKAYPGLYTRTAGYTFRNAMFLDLSTSQNQLQFHAYVSDPTDVARLMVGLTNSPDFQGLPTVSGVPDFNSAEQKKRQAETTEALPGDSTIINGQVIGEGGSGVPGGGGAPGMGGGAGGNGPAGGAMGGGGGNGPGGGSPFSPTGMGMTKGGPMGMPTAGAPAMGGGGNGPGGGAMGSSSGGGGGGGGDLGVLNIADARKKPTGFLITVSCSLKTPITRPGYGSSESQAGSSGGGGGGMGGMGMGGGNGPGGFGGGGGNGAR